MLGVLGANDVSLSSPLLTVKALPLTLTTTGLTIACLQSRDSDEVQLEDGRYRAAVAETEESLCCANVETETENHCTCWMLTVQPSLLSRRPFRAPD